MISLRWANQRYCIAANLQQTGVEIFSVGDAIGAKLDQTLRRLLGEAVDNTDVWTEIAGAARALRWRILCDPEPLRWNVCVPELAAMVAGQALRLRMAAVGPSDRSVLEDLLETCESLQLDDPAVGSVLFDSINEVGPSNCAVVAATLASAEALTHWLRPQGVIVFSVGELLRVKCEIEQLYMVGPPRFFSPAVLTAPVSSQITFLLPHWFTDKKLPESPITECAEGSFVVRSRLFDVNPVPLPLPSQSTLICEDDLLPHPQWAVQKDPDRLPSSEEVLARRMLLAGGHAVLVDNGDRIRTLDPTQPPGCRVESVPVISVQEGSYLLLRSEESEHGTLYQAALKSMGSRAREILESQQVWKDALRKRLNNMALHDVVTTLRDVGIRAASQVAAWADPELNRPQRTTDFQLLLRWLCIEEQPTLSRANELRNKRLELGQQIRAELEETLSTINLDNLMTTGYFELPAANPQFRGMVAIRVLAISPYEEIVPRQHVRVLFQERNGGNRWLE